MNKEQLCTIVTIIYHLTFLGGASFYVNEFQKTRDTIVKQVDRVDKKADQVKTQIELFQREIVNTRRKLDKVENACSKLRF